MGISMKLNESFMGGGPAGGRGGGHGGGGHGGGAHGGPSPTRHMGGMHGGPGTWLGYSRGSGGSGWGGWWVYPSFAYVCETDSDCGDVGTCSTGGFCI